jgi:RNA polymerase sigma-70 factor (ECF subfamily)
MRAGEEEAFREFYRRYARRLERYCWAVAAGNDEVAQEVLQRTLLRLARNIRPLPHEAALWLWLTRTARWAADDVRRGRRRYASLLARWADQIGAWLGSTGEAAGEDPWLAALDRALAQLEPTSRELIMGKYFEARSVRELARASGCTPKALEHRLAAARGRLRQAILDALATWESPP